MIIVGYNIVKRFQTSLEQHQSKGAQQKKMADEKREQTTTADLTCVCRVGARSAFANNLGPRLFTQFVHIWDRTNTIHSNNYYYLECLLFIPFHLFRCLSVALASAPASLIPLDFLRFFLSPKISYTTRNKCKIVHNHNVNCCVWCLLALFAVPFPLPVANKFWWILCWRRCWLSISFVNSVISCCEFRFSCDGH